MSDNLEEATKAYYEQENKRRNAWIEETIRSFIPEVLYLKWKSSEDKVELENMMRNWLNSEGYRMEISPDNILIQFWKGNEQVAQYQTVLPNFVEFVDGNPKQEVENN